MCAKKNHLLIFSSFLDIWENVEWPRFFGPPCIYAYMLTHDNGGRPFSTHSSFPRQLPLGRQISLGTGT